jgi:hypothetical protein
MSTIRVDNFGPSAGGTTYSARGIAKAWVNFDGTGTIAARDSENVSSLTDNGTGDYTVNFSNAFGAADYSVSIGNDKAVATLAQSVVVAFVHRAGAAPSASALRVGSQAVNSTVEAAAFDPQLMSISCHGDLA